MNQNPNISTRTLVAEFKKKLGIIVCHETARKKPILSAANIENRLSFAVRNVSQPKDY